MPTGKLDTYRKKRDFSRTAEPPGARPLPPGNRFVVHKHSATADHYDLRLEHNGVLLSWAVPKGPSLNPADKRLAMQTEDHPVDYIDFEGVIPEGEYGGGPMIVWDTGTWAPMEDADRALKSGALKFRLAGDKLKGGWMLARLKGKPGDGKQPWLLFKEHDPAASESEDILVTRPESVKSGRRIEQLVAAPPPAPAPARLKPLRPSALTRAVKAPLPAGIAPQLATGAAEPPGGEAWLHEIKLDGYRTMAYLEAGATRLITRAGLDWTKRYGTLPASFASLPVKSAVIDGEIVVPDDRGVTRFTLLQQALSDGPGGRLVFYAFDLLYLDGYDLRGAPLHERKALLRDLIARAGASSAIQFSDHVEGEAAELFDRASELGLEGLVSKRADARYTSGRSQSWVKAKALQTGSFVIAGYTPSPAAGGLGALCVAEWDNGELAYRGKIGTGFDRATLADLLARLERLAPGGEPLPGGPREAIWVRPVLSAQVHYATRTAEGYLRHAVFKGLREAELTTAPAAEREKLVSDADLAGVWVTNPTRKMFGKSGPTKLDIAVYYALIGDVMLPHLFNRPVSLVRCPTARPADCFFQRHAFTGMPPGIGTFDLPRAEEDDRTYLTVDTAKGYLALAQFGVVEFHTWGTTLAHIEKPDRVTFDLDPGEGIEWREVVEAALHVRRELEALKLVPFVKTTGGRGVHVVVPLNPRKDWKAIHAATGAIAAAITRTAPETFTTVMGAANRKRRIFIDFHRNARTATAVAPYSLRPRDGLPASTPLSWADLESIDSPRDLNYSSLPGLLTTSADPWAAINDSARELPAQLSKLQ